MAGARGARNGGKAGDVKMNLYLDTEFDGHGGELISLALAADDGKHWYGVAPLNDGEVHNGWVRNNVLPHLYKEPCTVEADDGWRAFRTSLKEYLLARPGCTIWADWPGDFGHLVDVMCGNDYADSFMIPCTMQLIVTPEGEPKPEIPHNALSDAIALMEWHQKNFPQTHRLHADAETIVGEE
jgi:hypothetical protein